MGFTQTRNQRVPVALYTHLERLVRKVKNLFLISKLEMHGSR